MNKVILIGRISTDPVPSKNCASGKGNVYFHLATDRGNDTADFVPVVAFNGTAKAIADYKKKGDLISVEGTFRVDDKEDGTKRIYCAANRVDFLSTAKANQAPAAPGGDFDDEDIPF